MITEIENAVIARLTAGMGRMVREVFSYGGELDQDLGNMVRCLPAAWVRSAASRAQNPVAPVTNGFGRMGVLW
ncbi:Mu-like prophage protein gp37 [Edwardsiella tarda]|nr:Mu-like prophage protein gp37 [Edwardsiella tarda]